MAKKKKAKKAVRKATKKKIITPKDAPLIEKSNDTLEQPSPLEVVEDTTTDGTILYSPEPAEAPIVVEPEPVIEPVSCAKCGNMTSDIVACPKCGALMCITCSGHSPCPRCGV